MKSKTLGLLVLLAGICWLATAVPARAQNSSNQAATVTDSYLTWSAAQATAVGKSWRANGRAGGALDLRVLDTDRSYNYKLRATLMTPEAIRAAARLEQLRLRLSNDQTRALVAEAETGKRLIVMVEIDPREGSGVIPLDWRAILQPGRPEPGSSMSITGTNKPELRHVKALAGVFRRDYDYDVFWVEFALTTGGGHAAWPVIPASLELVVGIYEKEGRVTWPVTESLRQHLTSLIGN